MNPKNRYDSVRPAYRQTRTTDPRIAAQIWAALGTAQTVINVGAGTGSYEPTDRQVTAVEPSEWMRSHRPCDRPAAVAASAEDLPFPDQSFDAAMAVSTVHHWTDVTRGLAELRRVTRDVIVLVTFDPQRFPDFWLTAYAPEFIGLAVRRCPPLETLRQCLPGSDIKRAEVPIDCIDGFAEAFYARPEAFLDPAIRAGQSGWHELPDTTITKSVEQLRRDLTNGAWDRHYHHLRRQPTRHGALTILTAAANPE